MIMLSDFGSQKKKKKKKEAVAKSEITQSSNVSKKSIIANKNTASAIKNQNTTNNVVSNRKKEKGTLSVTTIKTSNIGKTNSDGYEETNKKYGDYTYQDYADKKDYKIYKKDGKAYYYDEKRKNYVDMDAPRMTSVSEQDKKDYKEAIKNGYKDKKTYKTKVSEKIVPVFEQNKPGKKLKINQKTNKNILTDSKKVKTETKEQVRPTKLADQIELDTSGLTKAEKKKYTKSLIKQEKDKAHDEKYRYAGGINRLNRSDTPLQKDIIRPITNAERIYESGKKNNELALEYYNKMEGKKNKVNKKQKEIDIFNKFNKDVSSGDVGLAGEAIQNLNTQVEALKKQGIATTALGLGGTAVGGTVGYVKGDPVGGAAKGGKIGAKIGYTLGSTPYTYKLEAGNEYKDLKEMGVSDKKARKVAKAVGTINATIESGENILDLIAFSGAGKIANKQIKNTAVSQARDKFFDIVDNLGEKNAKKYLSEKYGSSVAENVLKSYAQNVISEGLEEGVQETVSVLGEKKAAKDEGIKRDSSKDLERIVKATGSGSTSALFTGIPTSVLGNTASYTGTKVNNKINTTLQAKQLANMNNEVKSLQQQIKNGQISPTEANVRMQEINNQFKAENETPNRQVDKISNLNVIAQQKVQELQQAVQQGKITPQEGNMQMEAITQTLNNLNNNAGQNDNINTKQQQLVDMNNKVNQLQQQVQTGQISPGVAIPQIQEINNQFQKLNESPEINNIKQKQLNIIKESNPAPNEFSTWIRNVNDIKTFDEAFFENGEYLGMDPDFTQEMAQKALDDGKITVYSSTPIENGAFVSPSQMEASQYAGGDTNNLYSKEVSLNDVAWIDGAEGQYTGGKSLQNSGFNQSQVRTTNKDNKMFSIVAPYYSQQVNDTNYEAIKNKIENKFTNKAQTIADGLGIEINNIQDNVGGYSFDDGNGRVDELSYTYQLGENTTPEQAKMFGCLLGDLGHEVQESVVVGNYTNSDNADANLEYTLKLNSGDGIIEALKASGITDYTFNKQTNELQLLLFKDNDGKFNESEILDQFERLNKELGGNINEPTKNYISSELIESKDRQNLYETWLESNRGQQEGQLYKDIEQAYEKVKEFNLEKEGTEDSSFSNDNFNEKRYQELKDLVDARIINKNSELYKEFKKLDDQYKEMSPVENDILYENKETNDETLKLNDDGTTEMIEENKPQILDKDPKQKKTLKESIIDTTNKVREKFVDHRRVIYDMARKLNNPTLYHMADEIDSSGALSQYQIGKAQTNLRGKPFNNFIDENGNKTSAGFEKIYDMYPDIPNKTKNEFLVHNLNIDRLNQGVEQFENFSYTYSEDMIESIKKEYPSVDKWAKNIWQYNKNQLQNMVDAGLISQKTADSFMETTPHYVRIQRDMGKNNRNGAITVKNGKIQVNNQIQKVKGSGLDIRPIKETTAQYTQDVWRAIKTNQFGQELAKSMSSGSKDNSISAVDESFGINPDLIGRDADGNYTFTIFNNGIATVVPINEDIAKSLQPRNIKDIKILSKATKIEKDVLTNRNPIFGFVRNPIKDVNDMFLYSKFSLPKNIKTYSELFAGRTFKSKSSSANSNKVTAQHWANFFESLGGKSSSFYDQKGFTSEKGKVSKTIDKLLSPIDKGNEFIESMPRLTEFVNTFKENGYTITPDYDIVPINGKKPTKSIEQVISEAKYNAADVTVNFKRGGTWAKNIDKNGGLYFNAGVQGASKFVRTFTEAFGDAKNGNYKAATRLAGRIMVLGIAPALIGNAMYGDDDEYKDLPDYIKDQYYLFKPTTGEGNYTDNNGHIWIRIPKGRAISLFQSASRRGINASKGEDFGLADYAQLALNQVAPNNPLNNNIVSPLGQAAANTSWNGSDIEPSYMKDWKESKKYDAKTSEISKWLGKKLNLSPKKIDYVLSQYSGAIGEFVQPLTTNFAESEDDSNPAFLLNPLKKQLTVDSTLNNKTGNEYYKKISKIDGSPTASDKDKLKSNYLSSYTSEISNLRKEQRKVQNNSNLSDSEKYSENKKLQKQIIDLQKEAMKGLDKISINSDYAKVGDKIYYKNSQGKWQKESDSERKKREWSDYSISDYYYYKKQAQEESKQKKAEKASKDRNFAYSIGISDSDFEEYKYKANKVQGVKDANGRTVRGSVKSARIRYINSLALSADQKRALYDYLYSRK